MRSGGGEGGDETPRPEDAAGGAGVGGGPEDPAEGMLVACGRGAVWFREVQPAGRRRMTAADWINGRGVTVGQTFE